MNYGTNSFADDSITIGSLEVLIMSNSKLEFYRGDEELQHWLQSYINQFPHHTTAVLSRSEYIGVSRAALDLYLAGTYFLPKELGEQGPILRSRL